MKFPRIFSLFMLGLLLIGAIVLVALPCVTHPVHLVNMHTEDASIRLSLGHTELWSGILGAGEQRYFPVVTDEDGGELTFDVTDSGGTKIGTNILYVLRHPKNIPTNVFVVGSDGVSAFHMDHPLLAPFESETVLVPLNTFLLVANVLRCLDCSKVRIR